MHWGTTLNASGRGKTRPSGSASGRPPWRSRSRSPASLTVCSASSSMPCCPEPPAAWNDVGVIATRPARSRRQASNGVMVRVVQLGLATIPSGWSSAAAGLTSASTRGTCGCMRQALELSITTAPRAAATGAHSRDTPPPAEKKATAAPSNAPGASASTSSSRSPKGTLRPTERAEATRRTSSTGSSRSTTIRRRSSPTAPVAPTITAVVTGASPRGCSGPSPDHRDLGRAVGVLVAELGLLGQVEPVVDGPHRGGHVAGPDHAGDPDRRGGDHLDVHARLGQRLEHRGGYPRARLHARPDQRHLGHVLVGLDPVGPHLVAHLLEHPHGLDQGGLGQRERDVGGPAVRDVLH